MTEYKYYIWLWKHEYVKIHQRRLKGVIIIYINDCNNYKC